MAVYTQIDNPELYFQCKLYTGTGSDGNAITLDGDENMQPDFLWIKERSTTNSHRLYDSVRGVNAALISNSTAAEDQYAAFGQLESFDSDGFTVGAGTSNGAGTNASSATIVAWCWKESADAGFDIVTYSGSGSARTISHSLSAVPKFIVTFDRTDGSMNRNVYHASNTSAPETDVLALNENYATSDSNIYWNDTAPTSSVFSLGTAGQVNDSGDDYVAYLWSEKQGFSKFGSYTGNGNADGTFVHLGFRPAYFLLKSSSNAESWHIYDSKRANAYNPHETYAPTTNASSAEATSSSYGIDFLSNGVKIRGSGSGINGSGYTFIYMAFAEAPFVNSNGVPCNAR